MKKFIWVFFTVIAFLFAAEAVQISHRIYISSIYFKNEGIYEATYFSPSSLSVGKTDGASSAKNTLLTISATSIEDTFNKAEMSTDFELNYRHVVSIILHTSFLNGKNLDELFAFLVNSEYIDYNFNVFVSEDEAEDIFSFQNPDDNSSYYSILNVTADTEYLFNYVSPLSIVTFLREFNKPSYIIKIPQISVEEEYTIGNEQTKNLKLSAVMTYSNGQANSLSIDDEWVLLLLNSFDNGKYYVDSYPIIINQVVTSFKRKSELTFKVRIRYKCLIADINDSILKQYLEGEIRTFLDRIYAMNIDYLNIGSLNNKYNKEYSFEKLKIEVSLNHN